MSATIRTTKGTVSTQQTGYSITPIIETRFTDWNDGAAVAHKLENRRDDILLKRPTMEMSNDHLIGYNKNHSPPESSYKKFGKDLYERLQSHNRDTLWKYREDSAISQSADSEFKTYLLLAFASEVGLNSFQKQCALKQFMQLDLRQGTGRAEINALAICSLVANRDAERYGSEKIYHPQRSSENNDEAFQRLEDMLTDRFAKITKSTITKVYNKLSQGNPPTRHPSKWKGKVKRESCIPQNPSFASEQYDPSSDME